MKRLALAFIRTRLTLMTLLSPRRAGMYAFRLFCTPTTRNRNPLPPVFSEAETLHFTFTGQQITGYRWNKGGHRRVLLIHGFESSVVNFDQFVTGCIDKGYEVLAFDAPAHGRSTGKEINGMEYKNFLLHICSTYGPADSFLAHSFGGLAVCLALSEMPHTPQTRLVLIAPATETMTAAAHLFRILHITNPRVITAFHNRIREISGHDLSWFSISRSLAHIRATVLWVQDLEDTVTPWADAEKIQQRQLPNIEFVITKGLGHRRIYRDLDVIKKINTFI